VEHLRGDAVGRFAEAAAEGVGGVDAEPAGGDRVAAEAVSAAHRPAVRRIQVFSTVKSSVLTIVSYNGT